MFKYWAEDNICFTHHSFYSAGYFYNYQRGENLCDVVNISSMVLKGNLVIDFGYSLALVKLNNDIAIVMTYWV
jgi:hypothetical protein